MVTKTKLNKSQCELGWELFGDRCIGAWAPRRLSRVNFGLIKSEEEEVTEEEVALLKSLCY